MLMIVKIFGLITLIKSEIWLTSYGKSQVMEWCYMQCILLHP